MNRSKNLVQVFVDWYYLLITMYKPMTMPSLPCTLHLNPIGVRFVCFDFLFQSKAKEKEITHLQLDNSFGYQSRSQNRHATNDQLKPKCLREEYELKPTHLNNESSACSKCICTLCKQSSRP